VSVAATVAPVPGDTIQSLTPLGKVSQALSVSEKGNELAVTTSTTRALFAKVVVTFPAESVARTVTLYIPFARPVGTAADQLVPVTVASIVWPPTITVTVEPASLTVPVSMGVALFELCVFTVGATSAVVLITRLPDPEPLSDLSAAWLKAEAETEMVSVPVGRVDKFAYQTLPSTRALMVCEPTVTVTPVMAKPESESPTVPVIVGVVLWVVNEFAVTMTPVVEVLTSRVPEVAALKLPAESVAETATLYVPLAKAVGMAAVQSPELFTVASIVWPATTTKTVALGSLTVPVRVGVELVAVRPPVIATVGAVEEITRPLVKLAVPVTAEPPLGVYVAVAEIV
jgi:hypothetical protein